MLREHAVVQQYIYFLSQIIRKNEEMIETLQSCEVGGAALPAVC